MSSFKCTSTAKARLDAKVQHSASGEEELTPERVPEFAEHLGLPHQSGKNSITRFLFAVL